MSTVPPSASAAPWLAPWLAPLLERRRAHPGAPTIVVAHDLTFARETVRQVARVTGGVLGWDATTVRGLAQRHAEPTLRAEGVRVGADLELRALVAKALLDAVTDAAFAALQPLAARAGFREVVTDAVFALRAGGVSPDEVRRHAVRGSPAALAGATLAHYERRLTAAALTDAAGVLRRAMASAPTDAAAIVLLPTLRPFGLAAELVSAWERQGAQRIDAPAWPAPLEGEGATRFTLLRAATPADEVREGLRLALARGYQFDEIEFAASDPDTYGVSLASIAAGAGIPVTLRDGLPLARTRIGRALERWCAWLTEGLPEDLLREALTAGEWGAPDASPAGPVLAREVRTLQVGWGLARWQQRLAPGGREPSAPLRAVLVALLDGLTAVPSRGQLEDPHTTVPALAGALLRAWPVLTAPVPDTEADAMRRVRDRVEAMALLPEEPQPFSAALGTLRAGWADVRWWPPIPGGGALRASHPGAVHLVPLSDAGVTGRRFTVCLGMDADRLGGAALGDVVLPDALREMLGGDPVRLPTLPQRREEQARVLDLALARPMGEVVLSWSSLVTGGTRDVTPDARLLAVHRHQGGNAAAGFDDLRRACGDPIGALSSLPPLDGRDVWLSQILRGARPRDARAAIAARHPALGRGLAHREAFDGDALHPLLGLVPTAAERVGPFAGHRLSASALERFGRCGLRWFYHDVLKARPPEEAEYQPGAWLDALTRGKWLHAVFESFGLRVLTAKLDPRDAGAADVLRRLLAEVVAAEEHALPAPPPAVRRRELQHLERLAMGFLALAHDDADAGVAWHACEAPFGAKGEPADFVLTDGTRVPLTGSIDRVDRLSGGVLRIVDYKTGSPWKPPKAKDPFDGGRKLQPAVYAAAARQLFQGDVTAFTYWFPEGTGTEASITFDGSQLDRGTALVESVIEDLRAGRFLPTDDTQDCRWCDHREICRVTDDAPFDVESPRAEWVKAHGAKHEVFVPLLTRRGKA